MDSFPETYIDPKSTSNCKRRKKTSFNSFYFILILQHFLKWTTSLAELTQNTHTLAHRKYFNTFQIFPLNNVLKVHHKISYISPYCTCFTPSLTLLLYLVIIAPSLHANLHTGNILTYIAGKKFRTVNFWTRILK